MKKYSWRIENADGLPYDATTSATRSEAWVKFRDAIGPGTPMAKFCARSRRAGYRAVRFEPPQLCIEIVEFATRKVEKKLGPFASERLRDKADDGLNRQLDHGRFYTRFAT